MTSKQYIKQLTTAEESIRGKDVPQTACASVIDGLCGVIDAQKTLLADKDTIIADKDTLLASKDELIAKLNHQLKQLQRQIYGRRSEKLHADDPNCPMFDFGEEQVLPLSDDELKAAEQHVDETKSGVHEDAEKRRARKKSCQSRTGETYRIGPDVPRREPVRHYPEGYTPESMVIIGWNTHESLEMEKPRLWVRVDMDAVCKPRNSKSTDLHTPIFEAHGYQNCLPGCIAGNSLLANIAVDKWCNHLPEYRQVKRLEAMGIRLSTSSVNRWLHELADRLSPIYEQQMELVFTSPYQHIDESTIPVNDQKHKTRKGYIWSAVDGMGLYGLAFFYNKGSRGGKVLTPKLLHRRASIQSDGYKVYENIERSKLEGITTLYCMAHARRKFEQIKDTSPEARKVLEYIATLYELEANLKYDKADCEEISRQRQEKAVPLLGFIKLLLEKYKTVDTPQSALTLACNYALERWEGLCRYCEEGYYEIDNNAVERSIRPLTLGRKNWLFVDSDDSARDTAIYLTLIGSCNILGIAPYKYFEFVLPRLTGNKKDGGYTQLLPYKVAEMIKE